MFVALCMTAQFVLLAAAVFYSSYLPETPLHVAMLVMIGVLVVLPLLPAAVRRLTHTLALAPNAPPQRPVVPEVRPFGIPNDPGVPGSARPRAPAGVVHAFA